MMIKRLLLLILVSQIDLPISRVTPKRGDFYFLMSSRLHLVLFVLSFGNKSACNQGKLALF